MNRHQRRASGAPNTAGGLAAVLSMLRDALRDLIPDPEALADLEFRYQVGADGQPTGTVCPTCQRVTPVTLVDVVDTAPGEHADGCTRAFSIGILYCFLEEDGTGPLGDVLRDLGVDPAFLARSVEQSLARLKEKMAKADKEQLEALDENRREVK